MYRFFLILILVFTCYQTNFAQGDICSDAIEVELNEFPNYDFNYLGDYWNYNLDDPNSPCLSVLSFHRDVWLTFVADSADLVILREEAEIELYKGDGCSNLSFIKCITEECERILDFVIGERYYVRLVGREPQSFQFSLHITPPGPFDTDCTEPFYLTEGIKYNHDMVGVDNDPLSQNLDCAPDLVGDIWYAFDASSLFYDLNIIKGFGPQGGPKEYQLYKETCSEDNFLFCSLLNAGSNEYVGPLDIGSRYLLRLAGNANHVWQSTPFSIQLEKLDGAANDFCQNASSIRLLENETTCQGFRDNLTSSDPLPSPPCWTEDELYDSWLTFEALVGSYTISYSGEGNIAVYSGSCANPTLLGCGDNLTLSQLLPGQSYLIRTTGDGEVCISPILTNNDCSTATELILTEFRNPFDYPFTGATLTQNDCGSGTKDMWFSFVATSTKKALTTSSDGNNWRYDVALYRGDCTALNQIYCSSGFGLNFLETLVIGQEYFLKISTDVADFVRLELERIPENRDYLRALPITEDSCMSGRTNHLSVSEDLWYEWVPEFSTYSINVSGENLRIYNLGPNGLQTLISRKKDFFDNNIISRVSFIPGQTYYLSIDSDFIASICLIRMTAVTNDSREQAQQLNPFPWDSCSHSQFNFQNATLDLWEGGTGNCVDDKSSEDAWYYFIADQDRVILDVDGYYQLYKIDDPTSPTLPCPISDGLATNKLLSNLEIGKQYLIRVYGQISSANSSGNGRICLQRPQSNSNDKLENATVVNISEPFECIINIYFATINSATPSAEFVTPCRSETTNYIDVWYSFVATNNRLGIQGSLASIRNLEIYEKQTDGLHCHSTLDPLESSFIAYDTISQLEVGNEYMLRFAQPIPSGNENIWRRSFCLYELPPTPPNAEADTAIELIPSDNILTCNSTDTLQLSGDDDLTVWFKFTATAEIHQLLIDSEDMFYESQLYKKDAVGELELHSEHGWIETTSTNTNYGTTLLYTFIDFDDYTVALNNYTELEIGREYFIRMKIGLFSLFAIQLPHQTKVPYTVCLKTPPQPATNDYFLDALPLPVSNNTIDRTSGTATMSIPDYQDYPNSDTCQPPPPANQLHRPEAWYSFTASDTSLTLYIDNQAKYPEKLERLDSENPIILDIFQLSLDPYFSLYQLDTNGEYVPVYCSEPIDQSYILTDLNPSETYLIKIYYECLTYLTELNFELGLSSAVDNDGDGSYSYEDCDDNNPSVFPGQTEGPYNGIDDDCDPTTPDDDLDQDGYGRAEDCDDNNALISPGLAETPYNGIDDDCDPSSVDDDLDQDGFLLSEDCDDNDAAINANQIEIIYNGKDDDCNVATLDDDLDQDGFLLADDCDDNNDSINPGQTEIPYNGLDEDCDAATLDDDLDQDGFLLADDCDDDDANINPDAADIANNGIDEDCDGMDFTSSIYELENTTISIYPNPASVFINIIVDGPLSYRVNLYNLKGQLVLTADQIDKIEIENLAQGSYILELLDLSSNQKITERIIKK